MIPKENVIVTVTNEGYIKKLSLKSYQSADGETGLKPGDYITGLYSTTTTDTLLLFTNQGRYLYVPIYEVFDAKWKDLGKHISNLIPLSENEKIIGNMILDSKNTVITMITRDGISKRTQLNDLVVSRHSKPINLIKLKGGDELVSVVKDTGRLLMVSKNGYYVNVNSEEIPVLGTKAAGVKGINVKGDEVVGVISLDNDTEYLNIITSQKTAKRIKVADLEKMSRGKRGSTLIKKVKSTNYEIVKVIPVKHSTMLGIKIDSDIKNIKATEIPIMDLSSTGSVMSKRNLEDVFDVKELEEYKINEDEVVNIKEVPDDPADQGEEMTIDDFIEDFKI
jgi:topoisomerase-4 subunit A